MNQSTIDGLSDAKKASGNPFCCQENLGSNEAMGEVSSNMLLGYFRLRVPFQQLFKKSVKTCH